MKVKRADESDANQPKDERVRKLIEIITTQIKPKSWKVNGGKGTITFFKGKLIIRNTPDVHIMIGGAIGKDPVQFPKTSGGSGQP